MALILKDRVKETTTTTGTSSFALGGAVTGYQAFSAAIGNGNTTYYAVYLNGGTEWEVGIGTYSSSGDTLARTTILASSNSGSIVTFSAGTKQIWCDYPAGKAIYKDANGLVTLSQTTTASAPLNLPYGTEPTSPNAGDIWTSYTGLYFKNADNAIEQLDLGANSAGTLSNPGITVAGSGATIDVTSVEAVLFSLPAWMGDYRKYVIPAATGLALTDQSANYLIVSYNSGSPAYSITTNPALITGSDVVGACLLWRDGTQVHYQNINWGLSTASRINRRLVQTDRYQRASGLSLGESTGNVITLTAGVVWYGVSEIIEGAVTSASSNADFYYHVAGVWTKSTVSTYDNTQYDNGTALQTLSAGRYAVNWVYRYLDGSGLPKLAYVLGSGNYTQAQALASAAPTPPPILTTMAILVGRIIVLKSAATAFEIDSAFTQVFSSTTVTSHNDLSGLQGGTANEYYHLTNSEHTVATQAASSTLNGYLTSTDWTTFNSKGSGTVTSVGGTGTVNGITLTGTVTSSGNLNLGGTLSNVNLTTQVTGTLPAGNGGTGLTSPGASGNVLTSNGSAWVSSASSGVTKAQAIAYAMTLGF